MAVVEQGGRYIATVQGEVDFADDAEISDYLGTKSDLELAAKKEIAGFINNKNNTIDATYNLSGATNDSVTDMETALNTGSVISVWSVAVGDITAAESGIDSDGDGQADYIQTDGGTAYREGVAPSGDLQGPGLFSRGSRDYKITDVGDGKYEIEVGWPMSNSAVARRIDQEEARLWAKARLTEHVNKDDPYDGETKCATLQGFTTLFTNWSSGDPPGDYLIEIYESSVTEAPCSDAAKSAEELSAAAAALREEAEGVAPSDGIDSADAGAEPDPESTPAPAESSDTDAAEEEDDEKITLDPVDYQCVLLERIMKLKDQHETLSGPYKKLITVDTNGDPGDTLSIINHGGQTAAVKEILSLCPDIHALLVPYIKISRVDYDENGKPNGKEQPLSIPNFVSQQDVESILSGEAGRIPGAGIKSFSWALEGVQPEEADNNITATLVVWFQSVGDFFQGASQAGQIGDDGEPKPNFLDLIINSPSMRKKKQKKKTGAKPSDKPKKDCENVKHREYTGANFRIKVVAGWATPPNLESIYPDLAADSPVDDTMTRADALQEAVNATRVTLFLQQTRHDIDFKENGSLQLTVNYQASLTGILTAPNSDIFAPGANENTIAAKRKKLDTFKSEDADRKRANQPEKYEDEIDDLLKEIKKLEETDKLEKYRKLLAKLYEADKIYHIEIPVSELLESKKQFKLSEEERLERAREKLGTEVVVNKTSEYESELIDEIKKDKAGKSDAKKNKKDQKRAQKGKDDVIPINFMYLGDMIDNILLQITDNNGGTPLDFSFFLSETHFIDAQFAATIEKIDNWAQCGDLRDAFYQQKIAAAGGSPDTSQMYKNINIGDIPISLRSFQNWYVKNVVDEDRDSYYLLHFVKDIASQLITNALRSGCFGKNMRLFQRFDVQPLSFNKKGQAPALAASKGCVSVDAVARASSALTGETEVKDVGMGMILISTDTNPSNLRADFDADLERGIYHQYIGSACSLVKKINFKRVDMPYLREAKIQKTGELGPEQLRELYSVSVDMVGNNLYKNGTYIYVSPLLMNTSQEELNYLGLHGYYMVTGVKSSLTEKSFGTSITALQEGIEFDYGPAPATAPAESDARDGSEPGCSPALREPLSPSSNPSS